MVKSKNKKELNNIILSNIFRPESKTKIDEDLLIDAGYDNVNIIKEYVKEIDKEYLIKLVYSPMSTVMPNRDWIITIINADGDILGSTEVETMEQINDFLKLLDIDIPVNFN